MNHSRKPLRNLLNPRRGPRTISALALVSELVYDTPPSFQDQHVSVLPMEEKMAILFLLIERLTKNQ